MKIFEISGIKIGIDTYLPAEKELSRRECERMAVLRLLCNITGMRITNVCHNDDGSPFLEDIPLQISISHCSTHVAVAVGGKENSFGIDIENFRSQLCRVKDKFLSEEAQSVWDTDNIMLLHAWTIMEATYKTIRIKGLDIRNDIAMMPEGTVFEDGNEKLYGTSHVRATDSIYSFNSFIISPQTVLSLVTHCSDV